MIYSAFIEEIAKQENAETEIFKEDISYYYNEGINEVRKAKKHEPLTCIIPDSILLALLKERNSLGYTWKEYIEVTLMSNANQIYRQALIDIMQQKPINIDSDEFQVLFDRQNKLKLNIKEDKISGAADTHLIGLNNMAKVEGIKHEDKGAKVMFVAVEDNVTTKMCKSLDGQIFKVHGWNEFERYSDTNKTIKKYRCYGLITGLNLPPINDGFHWCRSSIRYIN